MNSKLIGSVLLIVGTTVGAGMLALPVVTAQLGFVGSVILLFAIWFLMTIAAFLILEVNLWLPPNSNLISMARATTGPIGQVVAWITYLLLLYSLLCAYVAGGSDLLQHLLQSAGIMLPAPLTTVLFVVAFGFVNYLGLKAVDYTNRLFMFVKLTAYFLLVILLIPFVSTSRLLTGQLSSITSAAAIMVTVTSFGYAAIIPSLREYFADDVESLKRAIIFGGLLPLVCYILWDMVIMGVLPLDTDHGLVAILHSDNSSSNLVATLSTTAATPSVQFFTKVFTSIAVITSFLGVSLCLSDFLADGLNLKKVGKNKLLICLLTFLPPVLIVLVSTNLFLKALEYAGVYCVILLMLLPAWMVWLGRYRRGIAHGFRVPGGKLLLMFIMVVSIMLLGRAIV